MINFKKVIFSVFFMLLLVTNQILALETVELKDTLKKMSLEDYKEIYDEVENKLFASAADTGYVSLTPYGGAGGFYTFFPGSGINTRKPGGLDDIKTLYGGAGGFLFHINKLLALGFLFGGMGGGSSKKINTDFYHYSAGGSFQMVQAKFKPLINKSFILDLDVGIGLFSGGYTITKTNESLSGEDIVRSQYFTPCFLAGSELRYRINPLFFVGLKAGYFYAKMDSMKRAGYTDPDASIDFSAPYIAITLGGNL
ncbi:MAG: hypothetical protein GY730_04995 [bacterium]|nr:hypothetical protein [bacterium]